MAIRYFSIDEVIAMHQEIMKRFGEAPEPLRAFGELESAINRPRTAAYYEEADLVRQAALLASGISQAQAFLDGNKRTALQVTVTFLHLNGATYSADSLDFAKALEKLAEHADRETGENELEAWLRSSVTMQVS